MPRDADTERVKLADKVRAYLARAKDDHALGLSYEEVGRGAKVSRGHFGRTDHPLYAELAAEIRAAQEARQGAREEARQGAQGSAPTPPVSAPAAPAATAERPAAPAAGVGGSPGTPHGALGDAELDVRLRFHGAEAARLMQVWLGHHRRQGAPTDAPLLLHDLDKALGALRHHAEALRALVAEHQRRAGGAADSTGAVPAPPAQHALF